ncbi:hypothetical protein QR680_016403 [Steinernema hermaphroditum]|uniref:Uncharacterized protein n=1 Tax=Steinernema hermaphroditum TaxID=289476 RepID=A0AA39LMI6_9BILA|nr:hypothetical protein QR680_016403 [Steinernema hermaphroditum]
MLVLYYIYGIALPLVTLISTAFYIRIIYVFVKKPKYRSHECYQIMIQIGFVQCLMCPGFVLLGVRKLFTLGYVVILCNKMVVNAARTEILLSFILALNRLKIMANLRYSNKVHKILLCCAWLFGLFYSALFYSPWAEFEVTEAGYVGRFDLTYPLSYMLFRIGSYEMLSATVATLSVYIVLVLFMIHQKLKLKLQVVKSIVKEKSVLFFAILKFTCDGTLAVLYHFGSYFLPDDPLVEFVLGFAYVINFLCLPPCLNLVLSRSLRKEVFGLAPSVFIQTGIVPS